MTRLSHPWPVRPHHTGWLVAAAVALVLLALLGFLDTAASEIGRALPAPVVTLFSWLTRLGDSEFVLVPSLALFVLSGLAALLVRKDSVRAALRRLSGIGGFIFVGVGLPGLITAIIKRLVGRARPENANSEGAFDFQSLSWVDWTYQSFPSGHATTSFALCFVVSFLFPRAFPLMLVVAALIAASRIVVGAHYPTDLLAGAIVGILGAYFVRNVFAWRGWVFERRDDGTVAVKPFDWRGAFN